MKNSLFRLKKKSQNVLKKHFIDPKVAALKSLKAAKKDIEKKIKDADAEKLIAAVEESGKSIDEVINMLSK